MLLSKLRMRTSSRPQWTSKQRGTSGIKDWGGVRIRLKSSVLLGVEVKVRIWSNLCRDWEMIDRWGYHRRTWAAKV